MCGIFGAVNVENASFYAYYGIYALQHRGQEGVGIASFDGNSINFIKKSGLVLENIKKEHLINLKGNNAISHVRYSTAGGSSDKNLQPFVRNTKIGQIAIVHNGNLTNYKKIKDILEKNNVYLESSSDTESIIALFDTAKEKELDISYGNKDRDILPYLLDVLEKIEGAYSLLILYKNKVIAIRDTYGFRPLVMGRKKDSIFFASESCALDIVEAEYWREVYPGEIVIVENEEIRSYRFKETSKRSFCIFEEVYFARPDSIVFSKWAYETRKKMGIELAKEDDIEPDIVIPVPDSGIPSAIGYAQEKSKPFEFGLIRNHYIGRSFIAPTQDLRNLNVLMKLNANRGILKDKNVVVVDDSLVRGTTSKRIVNILKEAGAKKVHLRISSPPVIGPCYYGIDTPTKEELIANNMPIEDIRKFIGATTLKYLSLDGLLKAVGDKGDYCTACFTEKYPIALKV